MSTAMTSMSGAVRRMPTAAVKTFNTLLAPSLWLSQDDAVVRDLGVQPGLLSCSIEVNWRSHVVWAARQTRGQGSCESRALLREGCNLLGFNKL